jgi:hypothetical protein
MWLLWVQHSHPDQLKALQNYAGIVQLRRLLLQPVSLLALMAALTAWIVACFRALKRNRNHGLVIFALALSTVFGLILFFVFVR